MKINNNYHVDHVDHPFKPIFNESSLILILGSFPSVKSRKEHFYYSHPSNRFWKLISIITDTKPAPETINDKTNMLIDNKIALWDVIESCDINGSSDNRIKNVKPFDIINLIDKTHICKIYANGTLAYNLYMKYWFNYIDIDVIKLPSTSSANARYSFDDLLKQWRQIKNFI